MRRIGKAQNKDFSLSKSKSTEKTALPQVKRVLIDEDDNGQRIDNYLLRVCKGVPKSHIYRILRSGEVRVNGGRVAQTYRLQIGDEVRIPPIRLAAQQPERAAAPALISAAQIEVIFEDDALLVVNKPAGMAVHGGSGISYGVIEQLRHSRPQARFLELAHRLDRETSGLLLVAKKRAALTALHDLLREGAMRKRYLTMVSGRWLNPMQHIKLALHKYLTPDGERRVSVDKDGKYAHSIVRMLRRWQTYSLLEVEIKTGRTHQIRVHLQALGFPLLGDDKYGDFVLNKQLQKNGLKRMFLHAAYLELSHPISGEPLHLHAPLAKDLQMFVEQTESQQEADFGEVITKLLL